MKEKASLGYTVCLKHTQKYTATHMYVHTLTHRHT